MKYCSGCGSELVDDAVVCIKCGRSVINNAGASNINPNDAPSLGYAFLCFFFPIVGLILFLVWNNTSPKKSKSCGKGALIGVIVSIVIVPLFFVLYTVGISSILNNGTMKQENYIQYVTESERLSETNRQNEYYLAVLKTLSNIMNGYENLPPMERRDRFDEILFSVHYNEPSMVQLFTVWKPNAFDRMDSMYIGRPGSTPTGQYAPSYNRESGQIELRTSSKVEDTMNWIYGPNSRIDQIGDSTQQNINWQNIFVIEIKVPIINPRTNEVIGGVGCIFIDNVN